MNFETANKKEYFISINEMINDYRRTDLINEIEPIISNIKQEMFDRWNVETISLIGEALEKNQFITNDISLFVKIKKDMFEDMVDSHYVQKQPINLIFDVDGIVWEMKEGKWINGGNLPIYKILL